MNFHSNQNLNTAYEESTTQWKYMIKFYAQLNKEPIQK